MDRRWVIVAFGDIRGFGSWTYRGSNSREILDPFINRFYRTMKEYVRRYKGYRFKYLGDGFMVLREFTAEERTNGAVFEFVKSLIEITRKAREDVEKCAWPRPDGFRIRIVEGHACKIMVLDPNDPKRRRRIPEYVEYPINTAQRLLEVNPETLCLATEGVITALGKYRSSFRVQPLKKPSCYPRGVNREDIDGLHVIAF